MEEARQGAVWAVFGSHPWAVMSNSLISDVTDFAAAEEVNARASNDCGM